MHLHNGAGYVKNEWIISGTSVLFSFNAVDTTVSNDLVVSFGTGDATNNLILLDYSIELDNR